MNVQEIIGQLKEKFGDSFDISKVTSALQGLDLKNINFQEIVTKLHADGLLKNVNLDSVKGGMMDGLKEKAGDVLGNLFHKK